MPFFVVARVALFAIGIFLTTSLYGSHAEAAPTVCRSCRGTCRQYNRPNTTSVGNSTDDDTVVFIKDIAAGGIDLGDGGNLSGNNSSVERRPKRESFIEMRTCSSRFQLELILIPICILMIPAALITLLLCVCCCGPKDYRGKAPEKMWGVRLSQKRRGTEDELEFKDGYVQRKDSKKAKFSTTVQVIERRRESDATAASYGTELAPSNPTIVTVNVSDAIQRPETPGSLKKTRFSDDVAILGEDHRTSQGV